MSEEPAPDVLDAVEVILEETTTQIREIPGLPIAVAEPGVAAFRLRAGAYLVDGALIAAVLALGGLLSFLVSAWAGALLPLATHVLPFAYLAASHHGTGQTVGKRLLRIRVVDEDSLGRITFARSALRALVALGGPQVAAGGIVALGHSPLPVWAIAVASGALVVAGNAWALVDCLAALNEPRRRTFHDRAAGTIVMPLQGSGVP
jgi:uncharacterized RDD family membrane protein YckC